MLQRGRGQGFREALTDDRAVATAALLECVVHDPRWDRQVEARHNYYGDLAFALEVDISPIESHLVDLDVEDGDPIAPGLPIDVLAVMARRGRADALAVLRRYVATGWQWATAIMAMKHFPADFTSGLDAVLVERFPRAEDLAEAVEDITYGSLRWPLPVWLSSNARISEARRLLERQQAERAAETSADDVALDAEGLRRALAPDAPGDSRAAALRALGRQGDPAVIEPAIDAIRSGTPGLDVAGRAALFQLLRKKPLERARDWIGMDGHFGDIAIHMLEHWGTSADAPVLRDVVRRALDGGETNYNECAAVEGLVRLEDSGSLPLFERVYVETDYSYLRVRAARGLSKVSPTFSRDRAVECLWDCEPGTRMIGCATAELSLARMRIDEIAADEMEEDDVRASARSRL